jgi:flagellar basal body-associated protein FliL
LDTSKIFILGVFLFGIFAACAHNQTVHREDIPIAATNEPTRDYPQEAEEEPQEQEEEPRTPSIPYEYWEVYEPLPPVVADDILPWNLRSVSLGSFTANLALGTSDRSDSLVLEVVVGLNADADYIEEIYERINDSIHVARSEILDVLLSRTYYQVRTLEGRAETAEIIKNHLQNLFHSNAIVTVVFPEWYAVRGR